jgi:outer membrane biosynthesis protein TonB
MYNQDFQQNWLKSLGIHTLLIMTFLLLGKSNFFKTLNLQPKQILPSVRVDIVDLPKETLEELKKMEMAPPPVVKQEQTKQIMQEPIAVEKKSSKDSFEEIVKKTENRLAERQLEEFKKINEQRKVDSRREEMRQILLAGNKIQAGSQLQGAERVEELTEFDRYIVEATEKVKLYWKLPTYLQQSSLRCRLQVFVNAQGSAQLIKIYESSGNPEYDSWALKSVNDAIPFKIPLEAIVPDLLRGKFILGFPL